MRTTNRYLTITVGVLVFLVFLVSSAYSDSLPCRSELYLWFSFSSCVILGRQSWAWYTVSSTNIMWHYTFAIYESIIQEIAGFVKVGGDTYLLREDRVGDECQDYYDNCFYKKEGDQKLQQFWIPIDAQLVTTWLLLGHDMWWMEMFSKAFGIAAVGLNV